MVRGGGTEKGGEGAAKRRPSPTHHPPLLPGLAGALGFWPASVWAPIECYIKVFRPRPGVTRSLRVLSFICAIVTVVCVVSGVQQLVVSAAGFELFQAGD